MQETQSRRERAHRDKPEKLILPVLGLFMMTAPASTDMYLPAMVAVGHDLHATPGDIQLTRAYFFLGFAIGQLFWGALSDRYGRRLPLAAGIILLYIFGGAGSALAADLDAMNVWRFVQAFGGCAMPVIAQAMARDIYGKEGSARALSLMLTVMAIAPIASPLIGAFVLKIAHWRAIFWILAAFGVLALVGLSRLPADAAAFTPGHCGLGRVRAQLLVSVARHSFPSVCVVERRHVRRGLCLHNRNAVRVHQLLWPVSPDVRSAVCREHRRYDCDDTAQFQDCR